MRDATLREDGTWISDQTLVAGAAPLPCAIRECWNVRTIYQQVRRLECLADSGRAMPRESFDREAGVDDDMGSACLEPSEKRCQADWLSHRFPTDDRYAVSGRTDRVQQRIDHIVHC